MAQKIYVVTSGCYSDYNIDAVFTDRQKAEDYIRNCNFYSYDGCGIEVYDADTATFEAPSIMRCEMTIDPDTDEVCYLDINDPDPEEPESIIIEPNEDAMVYIKKNIIVRPKEEFIEYRERAMQVLLDIYHAWKAAEALKNYKPIAKS